MRGKVKSFRMVGGWTLSRQLALFVAILLSAKEAAAEGPKLRATAGRQDTRIELTTLGDATVIAVNSPHGIDQATIRRESDQWPSKILVRMHLPGLEMFSAASAGEIVEWSIASSGKHAQRVSLRTKMGDVQLDDRSPLFTKVRIVGGDEKIPLERGYFEIPLPAKLFESNPAEIKLSWIDFYRG